MRSRFLAIALTAFLSLVSLEEAQSSIYEESRLQKYLEDTLDAILNADSKARTRADGGTGLGLPISLAIAERHGGTLGIDPHHRGGARFVLTLPRSR